MEPEVFQSTFCKIKELKTNSKVFLCEDNEFGVRYAGKNISKNNPANWKKELNLLKMIGRHENIVNVLTVCTFADKTKGIIMELCDCNLEEYVQDFAISPQQKYCAFQEDASPQKAQAYFKCKSKIPLGLELSYQIANGLKYLHDNDIIHHNIQASNVLLIRFSQRKIVAKLSGFRYSEKVSFQNSKADDIYDLGSLIYYTLTKGHGCFSTTKKKQYFQKQRVGMAKKIPWFIQDDLDCSAASTEQKITSMNLIIQMVTQEPNHRLTIDKVLYHPAFYYPELKLQFLLTVYESLKKFYSDSENPLARKIDEINIQFDPKKDFKGRPYFFESSPKQQGKERWLGNFSDIGNVYALLKALRDKVAHCRDGEFGNVPRQFEVDFEVKYDRYNPAKFVDIIVATPYPHLLVNLYNIYNENDNEHGYAANFYPPNTTILLKLNHEYP